MSNWISVKARKPAGRFLAYNKWGHICIMEVRPWGDPDCLVGGYSISKDIKYWMPLPAPPKEER